ncbi:DUF3006 domain-containing protein [Brevibacillus brevis]|uniref:DUF3006 domain-containing protein n=1 Tax=Brevibacillus brevis TaxID=1393 RepID=UPI0007D8A541|nr:DUF3006 domain-containing protein [Brevibacillus brevis]
MKGIVDRFEGDYVVIEVNGETQDVEKVKVASGVTTGDVVELIDGIWTKDVEGTEKRSAEIKKLMDSVWED